jgi:hypothetical protein
MPVESFHTAAEKALASADVTKSPLRPTHHRTVSSVKTTNQTVDLDDYKRLNVELAASMQDNGKILRVAQDLKTAFILAQKSLKAEVAVKTSLERQVDELQESVAQLRTKALEAEGKYHKLAESSAGHHPTRRSGSDSQARADSIQLQSDADVRLLERALNEAKLEVLKLQKSAHALRHKDTRSKELSASLRRELVVTKEELRQAKRLAQELAKGPSKAKAPVKFMI